MRARSAVTSLWQSIIDGQIFDFPGGFDFASPPAPGLTFLFHARLRPLPIGSSEGGGTTKRHATSMLYYDSRHGIITHVDVWRITRVICQIARRPVTGHRKISMLRRSGIVISHCTNRERTMHQVTNYGEGRQTLLQ